jgi:hypothetical protein
MKIEFSRHARRRASLYNIHEAVVLKILEGKTFHQGNHEVIEHVEGFKHPLKIVVAVGGDIITVLTNYPLRKGKPR